MRTPIRFVWLSLMLVTLVAALAAPVRGQVLSAQAPARDRHAAAARTAERYLTALMEEANLPGLSAAVAIDGEVVWSEAFGYADLERRVSATPGTRYRIGSIGKAMTAAAAAWLGERGRLDLDAPIGSYVDSLPEHLRSITARQLAGHLGGVRHYDEDESQISNESYATVSEALGRFARDSLLHPPGSAYRYSSHGYTLLSAAIEAAAGDPFLRFMRREVFPVLGMDRTVADHVDSLIGERASLYHESRVDGRLLNAPATNNSYKWAAGGYLSTAEDLARFASRLAAGGWIGQETRRTLFTSMITSSGDTTGYAMGWRPGTDMEGRSVVHHGGSSVGGRSFLLLYPEETVSVAILVNASRAPVFIEEASPLAHLFLDHDPSESTLAEVGEETIGTYRFETTRKGEEVTGLLRLTGTTPRPGWMEWDGGAVSLVLVDPHPGGTRVLGAGPHGAMRLRGTFEEEGFVGRWDYLGEASDITGRRVERDAGPRGHSMSDGLPPPVPPLLQEALVQDPADLGRH